jgi:hypothetical protein
MAGKGEKWCVKVRASKLTMHNIWYSFFQSMKPSMSFGIIPVMDPPEIVEDAFQDLYFMCLSTLGVNRNITKGWRMLPCCFQGLGLPNMALEKLSESLMWLQRHGMLVRVWVSLFERHMNGSKSRLDSLAMSFSGAMQHTAALQYIHGTRSFGSTLIDTCVT